MLTVPGNWLNMHHQHLLLLNFTAVTVNCGRKSKLMHLKPATPVGLGGRHGETEFYDADSQQIWSVCLRWKQHLQNMYNDSATNISQTCRVLQLFPTYACNSKLLSPEITIKLGLVFYLAKNGNSRGTRRSIFSSENKQESARTQEFAYPDCWRGFKVNLETWIPRKSLIPKRRVICSDLTRGGKIRST